MHGGHVEAVDLETGRAAKRVCSTRYERNVAGHALAQRKEIWQLMREGYQNDMARVRDDAAANMIAVVVAMYMTIPTLPVRSEASRLSIAASFAASIN
jgi:hypothetical protein